VDQGALGDLKDMGHNISQDLRIAKLASSQQGNVTRQQLLELGLSSDEIQYRVKTGRLYPVYPGVYSVGRPPMTALEKASAALLACGPDAALSHGTGMSLWGFWERPWPRTINVTLLRGDRRHKGIKIHRPQGLIYKDRRKHQGLWVTSPARTLLDMAPTMTARALTRAVNDARLSKHLKLPALQATISRFPNHPGTPLLAPFAYTDENPTRSPAEDDLGAWLRKHNFPKPERNVMLAGYERDTVYEEHKLIIEMDSVSYHLDPESFKSDRLRDATALEAGYRTIRLIPERLTDAEAARLKRIMGID
jgi:very-short-patch-repair endonuclease